MCKWQKDWILKTAWCSDILVFKVIETVLGRMWWAVHRTSFLRRAEVLRRPGER